MLLEEKQKLYQEFFTLPLNLNVNLTPFALDEKIPNEMEFLAEMPYSFKLATQVNSIEADSLRAVGSLSNQSEELFNFLKLQSQKIDLIMSYIVMQEDDQEQRYITKEFGAGGFSINLNQDWHIDQVFRLKIFMPEEASAVYCYVEIVEKKPFEQGFEYKFVYSQIHDEDREILVRTALHQQSKHLRKLAQEKSNQTEK